MALRTLLAAIVAAFGIFTAAAAQDSAWVQVEAQPTMAKAEDRAEAWASIFPDVTGYKTRTGWIAIVLGPYAPAEAAGRLNDLKSQGLIPGDAFVSDGGDLRDKVIDMATAAPVVTTPDEPVVGAPIVAPTVIQPADETPEEARASEALLTPEQRVDLQKALGWYGFYAGAHDGAFGKGTRASMAALQEAKGYEVTGILTTTQRNALLDGYDADQAEFGFRSESVAEAGIEITLPFGAVEFDGYEPPFVKYREKNGSGIKILLISEPGGAEALAGLYDLLQTLKDVPPEGERSKGEDNFTINATGPDVQSYAYAATSRGMVKGYLVVWKPAVADKMARILPALKSTFRPVGDKALDPGLVPMEDAVRLGLLAGLEVKRPTLSRSGFFVDAKGTVATVADAVAQCTRITIDHDTEATVTLTDQGIALLTPKSPLSPPAFAQIAPAPAPGTELAVAGYSYEDKLPAPVLTLGTFEEAKGLNGEAGLARLSAPVLDGDRGGPVIEPRGGVVGILIPGGAPQGKALPEGVAFAASAQVLSDAMTKAGLTATAQDAAAPVATPDAMNRSALGMTVLVSCWN
ncbi:serine protease [Fuscibacter oryzae]|uniref:Peptidoglycan-binding protein n=1 Tax=Fuscibacter oryzae TaxID=2803939 RepID=A0A8J7MTH5_9RHOB|nr:serine protease [Fuscibacter oryzae]MBL4928690.1 peptidoglycan-binding protein [Fuscibacter oryzae]